MTSRIDLLEQADLEYLRGTSRCTRPPFGWRCKIGVWHIGSCPAYPAWWNFAARRRVPHSRCGR